MHVPLIDETNVSFVYEGGGLESVTFSLAAHVTTREPVQFFIDERVQLVESGLISVAPLGEQLRDFILLSGWVLLQSLPRACHDKGQKSTKGIIRISLVNSSSFVPFVHLCD